ncbi:MAG TPA: FtsW/RodA/SpoVE family cell cycle protein, partial [Bdellovibrionota bacterium]|nr:FtsW/RodA/SpoVE family cell cycle protein [Bdellovibrionota bacterium]
MRRFFDTKLIDHFDWALFSCVAAILFLSLLNLYSATFDLPAARFFRSQLVWISIGTAVATFVLFFDYRLLERLSLPIYCLSVLLVALVLFTGRSVLGAQRWLQIGPLSLQPSELAKIGIVIGLARYFHTWRGSRALSLAGLFWPGLMTAVPVLLILKQPDLGTAIIVFSISAAMILFVGVRNRVLALAVVAALIAIPFAWRYALRPYQKS